MTKQLKTVKRVVEFILTDSDKVKLSQFAAKLSKEISDLDIQKRTEIDFFNSKIKNKQKQMNTILSTINEGSEEREVECLEVKNFQTGMMEWFFEDRLVHQREMTYDERQMDLTLGPRKKRGEASWKDTVGLSQAVVVQ